MAPPRPRRQGALSSYGMRPLSGALSLVGVLASLACDEYGPRIYTARQYQPEKRCIEASVPIGQVRAGELASDCSPVCLLLDQTVYVSRVCPPEPPRAIVLDPAQSPDCAAALELLSSDADCVSARGADAGARDGGIGAPAL